MADEVMSEGESDSYFGSDEEDGYGDDYDDMIDCDDLDIDIGQKKVDPEHFDFTLLTLKDVERLLNESIEVVSKATNVSNSHVLKHLCCVFNNSKTL